VADPITLSSFNELKFNNIDTRVSYFDAVGLKINEYRLKSIKFDVVNDACGVVRY
jgi:hypothetical protein